MSDSDLVQTAQHVQTLLYFRGIERLLIVAGAIACVVLGTLLFRWGVRGASSVGAEGAGHKLQLTNAAPGTVLALFGMIVMLTGLLTPTKIDLKNSSTAAPSAFMATSLSAAPQRTTELSAAAGASVPEPLIASNGPGPLQPSKATGLSILYGTNPAPVRQLLTDLQGIEIRSVEPERAATLLTQFRQRAGALKNDKMDRTVSSFLQTVASAQTVDGADALGSLKHYRDRARELLALER